MHPKTASLQHLNQDLRVPTTLELKRLYWLEYQRQHPPVPAPPPPVPAQPPQQPLIHRGAAARIQPGHFNPLAVNVRGFAEATAQARVAQARQQVAGVVGGIVNQPADLFKEFNEFIATIIRPEFANMSWSEFWTEERRLKFPHIWAIARRVLAIPSTTAPVESLFSTAGIIDNVRRIALSPRALELLTLIKANAKLLIDEGWIAEWIRNGGVLRQQAPEPDAEVQDAPDDDDNDAGAENADDDVEEVAYDGFQDAFEYLFM